MGATEGRGRKSGVVATSFVHGRDVCLDDESWEEEFSFPSSVPDATTTCDQGSSQKKSKGRRRETHPIQNADAKTICSAEKPETANRRLSPAAQSHVGILTGLGLGFSAAIAPSR